MVPVPVPVPSSLERRTAEAAEAPAAEAAAAQQRAPARPRSKPPRQQLPLHSLRSALHLPPLLLLRRRSCPRPRSLRLRRGPVVVGRFRLFGSRLSIFLRFSFSLMTSKKHSFVSLFLSVLPFSFLIITSLARSSAVSITSAASSAASDRTPPAAAPRRPHRALPAAAAASAEAAAEGGRRGSALLLLLWSSVMLLLMGTVTELRALPFPVANARRAREKAYF